MARASMTAARWMLRIAALTATAAAVAQPLPATVEDCLKPLQALVEEAHAVDLLDDQINEAEGLIARMERHCLAAEFSEAQDSAADVRSILATNK